MKKIELKKLIRECIKELLNESYQTSITDPSTGEKIGVEIEYTYYTGHRGTRSGRMDRFAEPDEPADVEIHHIVTLDGREIDLDSIDQSTIENLQDNIINHEEG